MDDSDFYMWGVRIVGGLAFVVAWIYAISTYGFFLGVGLGWIPAGIIGLLLGYLWPVVAAVLWLLVVFWPKGSG